MIISSILFIKKISFSGEYTLILHFWQQIKQRRKTVITFLFFINPENDDRLNVLRYSIIFPLTLSYFYLYLFICIVFLYLLFIYTYISASLFPAHKRYDFISLDLFRKFYSF